MQTLITIGARYVTKAAYAWPASVSTPASDSVMNPVEIANFLFPMLPYPAVT
jgi:hypothetical protein